MVGVNSHSHWIAASIVLVVDVALVAGILVLDKTNHVPPPEGGTTDTSAAIGWLGVVSAIIIFGCFGILIKTPAVVQAGVDSMIFTCYYGVATALVSLVIWAVAGSHAGLTFNAGSFAMGALFGLLWTTSQMCVFQAVQVLGYAVGPAIWIGLTICVSFVWGTAVFANPIASLPGAILALSLLVVGVCLAAASSHLSELRQQRQCSRQPLVPEGAMAGVACGLESDVRAVQAIAERGQDGSPRGARRPLSGVASGLCAGLFNGSLMVPLRCFQQGCAAIGVGAFEGDVLAPVAFLPLLSFGILAVLPVVFSIYYWRTLLACSWPNFQFSIVALPGLLTGIFWGMGNFNAMFATVYLGQTIGYPLTQLCLIISGLWGILYYKEISGVLPISLFILASAVIIGGAALDGIYG